MKKICVFLIIFINSHLIIFAQSVSIDTIRIVSQNYLQKKNNGILKVISSVESVQYNNKIVYYIINFQDSGWVLTSAERSTFPILVSSLTGDFNKNNPQPEAFLKLLENYKLRIYNASITPTYNQEIENAWNELCQINILKSETPYVPGNRLLQVSEFSEISWGQTINNDGDCSPSFNQYCPSSNKADDCNHYPAGCGAVAMAQIMWYWKWPFSYNWSIITPFMNNFPHTQTQSSDAIARLISDCGVKSDMNYNNYGSWTTINNVENALKYFNYNGITKIERKDWSNNVWNQIIRNEINCGRPVLYRGGDVIDIPINEMGEVHYFIIEGYSPDDPNRYYVNWGWRGRWDEVTLGDLTVGTSDFNPNQMAIIGISPTFDQIATNINGVNYNQVSDSKTEFALNSIQIPEINKTLNITVDGNLFLCAKNSVTLNSGFSIEKGGELDIFLNNVENINCDIQTSIINNIIHLNNVDDALKIQTINANSYEMEIYTSNMQRISIGAGYIESNGIKSFWTGLGRLPGTYIAKITLRNNCGKKIEISPEIIIY